MEQKFKYDWKFKLVIWWRKLVHSNASIICDCCTIVGFIIALNQLYFQSKIRTDEWDWVVAVVTILAIPGLLYFRLRAPSKSRVLYLEKEYINNEGKTEVGLFYKYIAYRILRTNSVINIAGDLSWLEDQFPLYEELSRDYSNIKIKIYYDETKISNSNRSLFTAYKKMSNISMIAYPIQFSSKILKGFIFNDGLEDAEFLSIIKEKKHVNLLKCNIYEQSSGEYALAKSFIESIDKYIALKDKISIPKSTLIGVSGINNIGKTSLCHVLEVKLGKIVEVINDPFISKSKSSDIIVSLFCLVKQLLVFCKYRVKNPDARVFIFDRTPFDNFVFLKYYFENLNDEKKMIIKDSGIDIHNWEGYLRELENEINEFMGSFDLIILLTPKQPSSFLRGRTSAISSQIRLEISKAIKTYYQSFKYKDKLALYRINKSTNYNRENISQLPYMQDILDKIENLHKE